MPHPDLSSEDIAQRGKALYQQRLRTQVETADNIGKIIAIDLNTGDYEIDKDLLLACDQKPNRPTLLPGQNESATMLSTPLAVR